MTPSGRNTTNSSTAMEPKKREPSRASMTTVLLPDIAAGAAKPTVTMVKAKADSS